MNIVVLDAQDSAGTSVPCSFTVTLDGTEAEVTTAPVQAVACPTGSVRFESSPPRRRPGSGRTNSTWSSPETEIDPTANDLAKASITRVVAVGVTITRVTMTVSRLRDVSALALEQLTAREHPGR